MHTMEFARRPMTASLLASLLMLAACGGGGGDSGTTTPPPDTSKSTYKRPDGSLYAADTALRVEEIKVDARASTVFIRTQGTEYTASGLAVLEDPTGSRGSGFIYDSAGHIVTNAHVVTGQGSIMVTIPGRDRAVAAELVAIAECEDLAALKLVSGSPYPALPWSVNTPRISMKVGLAGYPADVGSTDQSAPYVLTEGTINTDVLFRNTYWSSADAFFHTATSYGGNSGGPLIELDSGTVVGVHYASGGDNRYVALSSTTARGIVGELMAGRDVLALGFSGEMFYRFADASGTVLGYGLYGQRPSGAVQSQDVPIGVWVRGLAAGGKAKRAGVMPGDIITAIAGVRLDGEGRDTTMATYCNTMRSQNPNSGRAMDIEVKRLKAGGAVCSGEINGRVLGIKGTPSQACPETTAVQTGNYQGSADYPMAHALSLQLLDGKISGTADWGDARGALQGTVGADGAVSFVQNVTYAGIAYKFTYTGVRDAATGVMSGQVLITTGDSFTEQAAWSASPKAN
jgi:S1-C subfamily serine protease